MPRRPTQATLFDLALHQDVEHLTWALGAARAETQDRQAQLGAAQAQLTQAQAQLTQAQAEVARLGTELTEVRKIARAYYELSFAALDATPQPPGDLEAFTRDLLKVAHPDKWSQGQLATELAHELSVLLTKARPPRQGPLR